MVVAEDLLELGHYFKIIGKVLALFILQQSGEKLTTEQIDYLKLVYYANHTVS